MRKIIGMASVLLSLVAMTHTSSAYATSAHSTKKAVEVKVLSFNIHHAVGMDGTLDLERIARTIEGTNAEIIALQEVDNNWSERSNFEDQAKWLAERLDMHSTFAANIKKEPQNAGDPPHQYGTAILSTYPILESENYPLMKVGNSEQRGLLKATIEIGGAPFTVLNAHLGLNPKERQLQMNEIIEITSRLSGPIVIMGDLNATPESKEMQTLLTHYQDAFENITTFTHQPTDGAPKRIDYILTSKEITSSNGQVISSLASDHLPLTTCLRIESQDL